MTKPQTIQIFLPDGSPTSIREAEITQRLIKAILFPRNKLEEVSKREMVHYAGVYFLFGIEEDGTKPSVYVGEGENCFSRIQNHNRSKDFWTHCVVVVAKTNEFTKTDVKYLEHYCQNLAAKIGRFKMENGNDSQRPSISEAREHDLLDSFETIKVLLATLGYPLFEEVRKAKSEKELFICKGKEAYAEAELIDEGILVHKGSKCNLEESKTAGTWVSGLRGKLIADGILVKKNNLYFFESDHIFSSYSGAAATVLARRANGWKEWKNKAGKNLDELKRK